MNDSYIHLVQAAKSKENIGSLYQQIIRNIGAPLTNNSSKQYLVQQINSFVHQGLGQLESKKSQITRSNAQSVLNSLNTSLINTMTKMIKTKQINFSARIPTRSGISGLSVPKRDIELGQRTPFPSQYSEQSWEGNGERDSLSSGISRAQISEKLSADAMSERVALINKQREQLMPKRLQQPGSQPPNLQQISDRPVTGRFSQQQYPQKDDLTSETLTNLYTGPGASSSSSGADTFEDNLGVYTFGTSSGNYEELTHEQMEQKMQQELNARNMTIQPGTTMIPPTPQPKQQVIQQLHGHGQQYSQGQQQVHGHNGSIEKELNVVLTELRTTRTELEGKNEQIKLLMEENEKNRTYRENIDTKQQEITQQIDELRNQEIKTDRMLDVLEQVKAEIKQMINSSKQILSYSTDVLIGSKICSTIKSNDVFSYNYNFQQPFSKLTGIKIKNVNLPKTLNNITNDCNNLYIELTSNVSSKEQPGKHGVSIYKSGLVKIYTIPPGEYSIKQLLSIINSNVLQDNLKFELCDNNHIKVYSTDNSVFKLHTNINDFAMNILPILGFSTEQSYEETTEYIGNSKYDFQIPSLYEIYFTNISSQPVATISSSDSDASVFEPVFLNSSIDISNLEILFKDNYGKTVNFENKLFSLNVSFLTLDPKEIVARITGQLKQ